MKIHTKEGLLTALIIVGTIVLLFGTGFFVGRAQAQVIDFQNNLYYGLTSSPDVQAWQEFLTNQGVYSGPITGNFFSLTLAATKTFQKKESVSPISGYVGPITRGVANEILSTVAPPSEGNASTSTPAVDLSQIAPVQPTTTQPTPITQTTPTPPVAQSSSSQAVPGPTCILMAVREENFTTPSSVYQSGNASWSSTNANTAQIVLTNASTLEDAAKTAINDRNNVAIGSSPSGSKSGFSIAKYAQVVKAEFGGPGGSVICTALIPAVPQWPNTTGTTTWQD